METAQLTSIEKNIIEAQVLEVIKTCFDPEIPVNIFELGLIYDIKVDDNRNVNIKMTLTSPSCPAAQSLPPDVAKKVKTVDGVADVSVDVVWSPPWTPALMSEAAKLELGLS
jgi:FeS assembly SUF system protein